MPHFFFHFASAAILAALLLSASACRKSTSPQDTSPASEATPSTPPTIPAPPEPALLSRAEWNAKPPEAQVTPHTPQFITIHHTGTKQNPNRSLADKLKGLQAFSQREDKLDTGKVKPAWPDVPYHYYIAVNGQNGEAGEVDYVGDTNTAYDPTGHVLVTLEGSFDVEHPTAEQMASTKQLVAWLAHKYKVPSEKIKTHKDYAQTACPGQNLHNKIDELRATVNQPM